MTCRVFLVGEGPTDIGDLVELPGYRDGREGFLQPILRQMVAGGVHLEFFDGRKLTELKRRAKKEPPHHLQTRKAAQALALASVLGADALVFACDVDKAHGAAKPVERRRRPRSTTAHPNSSGATRTTPTPITPSASGGASPKISSRMPRSPSVHGPTCSNAPVRRASCPSRET